ncbi:lipase secretion chaperone [Acidovorax sp. NCPPB 3576]|uniref:lipase secretion chaperone n=1 Tax=Acidovorax sp. NCPPB 3576 TaxID=2940488 RepID=UPI00234A8ECF|nr:lipase secretion chaperone [Acidovorax sp. NCPPB 3576]WCM89134.1 lipase chaperone [Acidovorax sp. NCPPB 3576]
MIRIRSAALVACGLAAAAALLWWTGSGPAQEASRPTGAAAIPGMAAGTAARGPAAPAVWDAPAPPVAAASSDPLLGPGLRDTLEALLRAAGEAPEPGLLKARLEGLIGQFFPAQVKARALALAYRYVDYRVALGRLQAPADLRDPHALRLALAARQKVRMAAFEPDEYQALFAEDAAMDQYLLARMEIERDPSLTADQKSVALQQAEGTLGPALQAQRAEAAAHVGVARQTAAFDAQGMDATARFTARSAQYGAEAAQRLAQVDLQDRQWQGRLDQYQAAMGAGTSAAGLAQLRSELFTPQEQLRLDGALALRALPASTP